MDIDSSIKSVLRAHEESSIQLRDIRGDGRADVAPLAWSVRNRKDYPRLPHIKLSADQDISCALTSVLRGRRSVRQFQSGTFPLARLEALLAHSIRERTDRASGVRPYASAGARYPCEVYVGAMHVEGLADGLYFYDGLGHELVRLIACDVRRESARFVDLSEFGEPNLLIAITGVMHRSLPKYAGRGYRYCLMECGEIAHTLSLVSVALGLGCCLIGGFDDNQLADWLDVSWELEVEAPLLLAVIGNPSTTES